MEDCAMAKARSPEYPAIGLKEAVEKVALIYNKDYQNKLPKQVIAEHMGYKSLNGGSLPIIAALSKFGLIEGRGDETRVSDLGLAIVAHAPGSHERTQALRTAASNPELFSELDGKFAGGKASDQAIRSYLLTQRFIPSAADTAIRSYRETKELVEQESGGYVEGPKQEPEMMQVSQSDNAGSGGHTPVSRPPRSLHSALTPDMQMPLRVVMNGNRLDIQASVDLAGLKKLQEMLAKYQGILEMMQSDDEPEFLK